MKTRSTIPTLILLAFGWLPAVNAAATDKKEITYGAFLDTYYGYDFNQPTGDRSFTTQTLRHNEFSVNLAYVDVKLETEKVHGRLALQAGSSVYANYSGERRYGAVGAAQLADVLRHIQEAYGGYRLAPDLWIDAGFFFSHIGIEGFISKDNWNYTRSLAAEFTPYYQAGVRVNYQLTPTWLASLQVLNGWQNLIETNGDKALGMQVSYAPSEAISFTYNNFIGRESEFRFFNNFIFKAKLTPRWAIAASSDIGFQKKPSSSDYSVWHAQTLLSQYRLTDTWSLGGRVEYYQDKDQVIAVTGTARGFQTFGASLNVDWQPETYFWFRNELRALSSLDAVFPGKAGAKTSNAHFVSSVGLAF